MKGLRSAVTAIFWMVALHCAGNGAVYAAEYVAGTDYTVVAHGQPIAVTTPGKTEVAEFFWYGCPHCYKFEPMLEQWLARQPKYVEFVRQPAIFAATWETHALGFFVADALGVLAKFHQPFFDYVQQNHKMQLSRQELKEFFADQGLINAGAPSFDVAADSFGVQTKLAAAKISSAKYGVTGVPALVIAGKYRIDAERAKTFANMLAIADFLIANEQTAAQISK